MYPNMSKLIPSSDYCSSAKIRHENEEDARLAAREGMLRSAPQLYVYECSFCKGWHLTSSNYLKK